MRRAHLLGADAGRRCIRFELPEGPQRAFAQFLALRRRGHARIRQAAEQVEQRLRGGGQRADADLGQRLGLAGQARGGFRAA